MEETLENTAAVETTETTAPETVSAAPETATTETASASPEGSDPKATPPAYNPDYKFSAYGEEGEVEDWVKPYMKDKASEENFKKLYSKAHAFEKAREKLERTRGENQGLTGEVGEYKQGLNELRAHVKNKDFHQFFKRLNVPMAAVWEWVNEQVQYQELPPDQKARYDEAMRLKRENLELQNNYTSTSETHNQTLTRLANMELDIALSKPDYAEVQNYIDTKKGRKGAFREFVIQRGLEIERQTGKDCNPHDAIKDAVEWLDYSPNQEATPGQPLVTKPSSKPVIPNLKTGGVSPVKKRASTLKELRAEVAQHFAAKT